MVKCSPWTCASVCQLIKCREQKAEAGMNSAGFSTTYSLIDLIDELPLPRAINIKDTDRLAIDPLEIQNVQELQDIAAVVAPAIQMARFPDELDRLTFKDPAHAPSPNMRHHHAQATPLMSLVVSQHQQFQDVITVPPYQLHPQQPQQQQIQPQVVDTYHHPQPAHHAHQQQQMQPQILQPHHHSHPPHHAHHQQQQQPQQPQLHHPQHYMRPNQPQHIITQSPQHHIPPSQQHIIQPQQHPQAPAAAYYHQPQQQQLPPPIPQQPPTPQHAPPPQPQQQFYNQQQQHHQQLPQHQQHHPQHQQPHQMPNLNNLPAPVLKKDPEHKQAPRQAPKVTQSSSAVKRRAERERQREREREREKKIIKAVRSEVVIDTRNSTLEEVLEKFLQDSISEEMGVVDGNIIRTFTPKQLVHLVAITAKLKRKNKTKNVNLCKLTSLITTLTSQLQVQTEVLKNQSYRNNDSSDDNDNESDDQRMQKFETCCDCAVIALNVMTSAGMDSRVYLEECVESIVTFVNTALTIITDISTSTNFCASPKKSQHHNKSDLKRSSKSILFSKPSLSKLNAKCSEVLALVNDLLQCRTEATLNDSLLLSTSRAALTAFFLMDSTSSSNELQLNALNVITSIFASYKSHQTVILEELIHSIARLPTTKRNRVQYQIGSSNSESISIFSALIMKLIQSLFTIRKNSRPDDEHQSSKKQPSNNGSNQPASQPKADDASDSVSDYERLLRSQYNSALRASYAFLSSFLRRCCGVDKKDECDYRVLFETFVEDLMTCLHKPDWSSAQLITHVLIKMLVSNINPQGGKKHQQATNQTLKLASLEHLGTICARLIKERSSMAKYKREVKRALKAIDLSGFQNDNGRAKNDRAKSLRSQKKLDSSSSSSSGSETQTEEDGESQESSDHKKKKNRKNSQNSLQNNTEDYHDGDQVDQQETKASSEAADDIKLLSDREEQKFWLALLTFCQREKGITKCGRNIFCAIWLKELERRAKYQYEINNPVSQDSNTLSDDEDSQENTSQSQNQSATMRQYSKMNNNNNINNYGNNTNSLSEDTSQSNNKKPSNGPSAEDLQAKFVIDFFKLLSLSAKIASAKTSDIAENAEADEDSTIDEATASYIIKILDVSMPTTQKLIDAALSHIVAALSSTGNTNIRSKAMKSLSHVLNSAPKDQATKLLARDDLQKAIGASLLDQSTSVRESTVELIGRFILNSQSEKLIDQYYDMLTNRIMDSGVSVRKRVIKILREICIAYPSYPRVPEICSIMIKRINDEGEGIRKLVSETFTSMWFKEERTHEAIVAKVACITHVVATVWSKILAEANKSTGTESHFEWLHQLLSSLLKPSKNNATGNASLDNNSSTAGAIGSTSKRKSRNSEQTGSTETGEDGVEQVPQEVVSYKQTIAASTQIISVLVSEKLANGTQESTSRADCLAAMTALWSFAKIIPLLLTHYLDLFQSFLSLDPKSSFDLLILEKVIQIIELILPSISNPSVTTMNSIETNLAKLIIRGSIRVISVSVSCLSELIHRHSHNQQLASDTFRRFLRIIRSCRANPEGFDQNQLAYCLRALYTCGLLAKHFNIDDRDVLYNELIHFVNTGISQMNPNYQANSTTTNNHITNNNNTSYDSYNEQNNIQPGAISRNRLQDERILLRSLEGLGFMFERSPSLMLQESTTRIYRFFMRSAIDLGPNDSAVASISVLTNLRNYLQDEVTQEIKSAYAIDWSRENLKEMTSSKEEDANSVQSSVIQLYLRDMLSCALSSSVEIRKAAIKLIHSVHNGGHINPLSIVPSLIALSSDDDTTIRVRADHVLQEIERKYSNFVTMKSKQGVLESFILNRRKRGFHRLDIEKQAAGSNQEETTNENNQTQTSSVNNDYINVSAKLATLYSVVATNRQQRRAFIMSLLRYFDIQTLASVPNMLSSDANESRFVLSKCTAVDILLYVNDNLMFLPFTLLDEPFFLIHQIGITLSNLISQAVSAFREILQLSSMESEEVEEEDIEVNEEELSDDSTEQEMTDDEEDLDIRRQRKLLEKQNRVRQRKLEIRQRRMQQRGLEKNLINAIEAQENQSDIDDLPVSILQVRDLVSSIHGCILLMHCRRVIWDLYSITDQKFEDYTPNESSKITDKPVHRRNLNESSFESLIKVPPTTVNFDSEPFLRSMYSDIFGFEDDLETSQQLERCAPNRHKLKLEYKRFSQLMTK